MKAYLRQYPLIASYLSSILIVALISAILFIFNIEIGIGWFATLPFIPVLLTLTWLSYKGWGEKKLRIIKTILPHWIILFVLGLGPTFLMLVAFNFMADCSYGEIEKTYNGKKIFMRFCIAAMHEANEWLELHEESYELLPVIGNKWIIRLPNANRKKRITSFDPKTFNTYWENNSFPRWPTDFNLNLNEKKIEVFFGKDQRSTHLTPDDIQEINSIK